MAIEVMLMADVPDLGQQGDVVRVAEGFARNFLFRKSLAAPVTDATRRKLVKARAERDAKLKLQLGAAQALADKLASLSVTLTVKTSGGEKLYGSVTGADIAEALKKQGVEIEKQSVQLEEPIRSLGVFSVNVNLHPSVSAAVKVWIVEE
jgi:large subunit ribosomal protein L9